MSTYVKEKPDLELISDALEILNGVHDFTHFTTPNAIKNSPERRINYTKLIESERYLFISINGEGFLRYMVRAIIGSLLK